MVVEVVVEKLSGSAFAPNEYELIMRNLFSCKLSKNQTPVAHLVDLNLPKKFLNT